MAASSFMSFDPVVLAFFLLLSTSSAQLTTNFYSSSCPNLFSTIKPVVQSAIASENRMGASLLRLFFHDCFVNVRLNIKNPTNEQIKHVTCISQHLRLTMLCTFLCDLGLRWIVAPRRYLKLYRGEECESEQEFSQRVRCHRQDQDCSWEGLSECCVMCWYLGSNSKGLRSNSE